MLLNFLWSAQVSDVFLLRRPLLSFFCFEALNLSFEDAVRLLVVPSLGVTPVVVVVVVVVVKVSLVLIAVVVALVLAAAVVVAVVNVILLADGEFLFPRAPALAPTSAVGVVALFPS